MTDYYITHITTNWSTVSVLCTLIVLLVLSTITDIYLMISKYVMQAVKKIINSAHLSSYGEHQSIQWLQSGRSFERLVIFYWEHTKRIFFCSKAVSQYALFFSYTYLSLWIFCCCTEELQDRIWNTVLQVDQDKLWQVEISGTYVTSPSELTLHSWTLPKCSVVRYYCSSDYHASSGKTIRLHMWENFQHWEMAFQ
jgi:hypothetical protein